MRQWIYKSGGMLVIGVLIIVANIVAQQHDGEVNNKQVSVFSASYLEEIGIKNYQVKKIPIPKIIKKSVMIHCTEKEMDVYIKTELGNYDSLRDTEKRIVQEGDFIQLEYALKKSFRDSQETVLKVGNNLFDAEIEKALIGKQVKKTYTMKSSKGETVYIKIKTIVQYIQQTLTEKFVKETLGFESTEDYKAYVKKELLAEKRGKEETEIINTFYDKLLSESEIILDEKELSEYCMNYYVKNEQQLALASNKSFEEYIQETYHIKKDEYYNQVLGNCETRFTSLQS